MDTTSSWATANLSDAYEPLYAAGSLQVLKARLMCMGGVSACHGPISTIRCFEDTSRVHEAVREPGLGRVLLIDGAESADRVVLGGSIAQIAFENQWAGIIALGSARDYAELRAVPIAVYATATTPRRSLRAGTGERDVPLTLPGCVAVPGAWLYADEDGVLISAYELQPAEIHLCR